MSRRRVDSYRRDTLAEIERERSGLMHEIEIEAARGSWAPKEDPRDRRPDSEADRAARRAQLARNWIGGDP